MTERTMPATVIPSWAALSVKARDSASVTRTVTNLVLRAIAAVYTTPRLGGPPRTAGNVSSGKLRRNAGRAARVNAHLNALHTPDVAQNARSAALQRRVAM